MTSIPIPREHKVRFSSQLWDLLTKKAKEKGAASVAEYVRRTMDWTVRRVTIKGAPWEAAANEEEATKSSREMMSRLMAAYPLPKFRTEIAAEWLDVPSSFSLAAIPPTEIARLHSIMGIA